MEDQPARRRGGVDVLGERAEASAARLDRLHDVEKVAQRAGEAVVLGDDDHVSGAELVEELIELRPRPGRAADLVGEDALRAGGREGVVLGFKLLVVGRDAGVSKYHPSSVPESSQNSNGFG